MRRDRRRKENIKNSKKFIIVGLILVIISSIFFLLQENRLNYIKKRNIYIEKNLSKEVKPDKIMESAVGVIRINKINIILPIFKDTTKESLANGVGILESTDIPSSKKGSITVLAGHRGGKNEEQSFLNIDKLKKNDKIKITTRKQILHYSVVDKEVIEDDDWSKFYREKDKVKLILISCHPYPINNKRLLVKAYLTKVENI